MSIVAETATLAHGYTMGEIDRFARMAAARRRSMAWDRYDQIDTAWHAIVEFLYTSTNRPHRRDLLNAGANAVLEQTGLQHHHSGYSPKTGDTSNAVGRYWLPIVQDRADFTDRIAERLSLPSVLGQLTPMEYEAIAALAAHESQVKAAAALGLPYKTFVARVARARKRIEIVWFEHETPPVRMSKGPGAKACRYGHPRSEEGFKYDGDTGWRCRRCERNRQRRARARTR